MRLRMYFFSGRTKLDAAGNFIEFDGTAEMPAELPFREAIKRIRNEKEAELDRSCVFTCITVLGEYDRD